MSVYRPSYRDKNGVKKVSNIWWYNFRFGGKTIQESSKSTKKTVARVAEENRRRELQEGFAGLLPGKKDYRIYSVNDVVAPYLKRHALDHSERPKSVLFAKQRLQQVTRLMGKVLLHSLTEDRVRDYISQRILEGVGGRTINGELGELSRAIGKPWKTLWPTVRKREERKDVGRALSPEEEVRLLDAAGKKKRWQFCGTIVRIALMTAMRSGEITGLTWARVDLDKRVLVVGKAKTPKGTDRQIPLNNDLFALLSMHRSWFESRFGKPQPEQYLFPFGPTTNDPTRPTTALKTAWNSIRKEAQVSCRLHDLRHTALTKLAEAGVPESTMLALAGHMSRAMLERYSHIRMAAKRTAVEALAAPKPQESAGLPKDPPKVAVLGKLQ